MLELLQLFCAHLAILLAPAIIGLLNDAYLSYRIQTRHALPHQNVNVPYLWAWLACLPFVILCFLNITMDPFKRGGSLLSNHGLLVSGSPSFGRVKSHSQM